MVRGLNLGSCCSPADCSTDLPSGGLGEDASGLAEATSHLDALVTHLPIVLFELDRTGQFVLCEGKGLELLGSRPGAAVGTSVFVANRHMPEVLDAVRAALAGHRARHTLTVRGRVLEILYLPKLGAGGAAASVTGIAYDITELHQQEAALAASEGRLRRSEARFRSLVMNMRDIIFCHGVQGGTSYGYDQGGAEIYGADAGKLAGTVDEEGRARIGVWYEAVHPEDRPAYLAAESRRKERHEPYSLEYRITHPATGEQRWMREVAWVVKDEELGLTSFDSYILDITEQKSAELALRESEERYRRLIEAAPVAILICTGGSCVYANPRAIRLLGGERPSDLSGRSLTDLVGRDEARRLAREIAAKGEAPTRELVCARLDGALIPVEASAAALVGDEAGGIQLVLVDLAERKRAEAMRHLAQHDALTGLPNRLLLFERLEQGLAAARAGGTELALMLLDLDGLKEVNDTYGHAAGDELLRQVARRVRDVIRDSDTLARLGGDEFALLQLPTRGMSAMALVAARIVEIVAQPFTIEGREIRASISIGIAACVGGDTDADGLLRRADMALYRAKQDGRGRFRFYDLGLDAALEARRRLEGELRDAFERRELHLAYQPELDLATRRVVGVEALLRWDSLSRGRVAPAEFIPVAEATGLIRALGGWVLEEACTQARTWREQGLDLRVAVNVSALQLQRPDFADLVSSALRRNGLPPAQLCLELTESLLIDPQLDGIGTVLDRVTKDGVRIAIDDFGTGYSSLLNLKRLPVHHVKIDRSFVQELDTDSDSEAIVRATVSLAHSLGKTVIAEGVETEAQHRFLASLGCDRAQGFAYARPDRAEALGAYLAAHA